MSVEAHSGAEDSRARAALHRSRATDLRKQAEIEEASAAELDGEVRAVSSTSCLSWKVFMTKARNCGMVVPEN